MSIDPSIVKAEEQLIIQHPSIYFTDIWNPYGTLSHTFHVHEGNKCTIDYLLDPMLKAKCIITPCKPMTDNKAYVG
jgi:hypothetical protein